MPPPQNQWDAFDAGRQKLYITFLEGLASIGQGFTVQRSFCAISRSRSFPSAAGRSAAAPSYVLDRSRPLERTPRPGSLLLSIPGSQRHRRLLRFLDHHPLVRHIDLPPVVVRTIDGIKFRPSPLPLRGASCPRTLIPTRSSTRTYPRMGVIDGGISRNFPIGSSVVGICSMPLMDLAHGTFIGGLAVAGSALNGNAVCSEPDGAEIVDVAVYPTIKTRHVPLLLSGRCFAIF